MNNKLKSFGVNVVLLAIVIGAGVPLGRYAAKYYNGVRSHIKHGNYSQHVQGKPFKVTLYGTSTCQYCKEVRAYLRRTGVEFNDLIVDKSPEAERGFKSLNETVVPVLVTKDELITGYREAEIDAIVQRSKQL